jgi:diadenylate cyclase
MEIIRDIWMTYLRHAIDLFVSTYIIYKLLILISGTRAVQVLRGIILLLVATVISEILDLVLIGWMLRWFWVAGAVALVIVFQPEIRSFLAHIGSGGMTRVLIKGKSEFINEVIKAMKELSKQKKGGLIVFENETGLRNFIETGIRINAEVSAELLQTIFTPPAPIHDGAVILSGARIAAAGCILPLTHNPSMSKVIGTRHRAAVGLSEVSDAFICVVSEETGEFSLAYEGALKQDMDIDEIRRRLISYYKAKIRKNRLLKKDGIKTGKE